MPTLRGTSGPDRIEVTVAGDYSIFGDAGNDILSVGANSGTGHILINGDDGDDFIQAGNVLIGGATLTFTVNGGAGNDDINVIGQFVSGVFDGGGGRDHFSVE